MLIFIISLALFYFFKKEKKYGKINFFFYLILSSIFSPIIFIFLSDSIISIYHFADIIIFILILHIFIGVFSLSYEFIKSKKISKNILNQKTIFILVLFLIFCTGIYENNKLNKNKSFVNEIIKLENF